MKKILKVLGILTLFLVIYPTSVSANSEDNDDNFEIYISDRNEHKSGNVNTNGDQIIPFDSSIYAINDPKKATFASYPSGTYNWVYDWNSSSMAKYNCYAFVLDITQGFLEPGDFSGRPSSEDIGELSVTKLNNYIINDIKNLGYRNVKQVAANYQPASNEYMIAFRRGYFIDSGDYKDFHFMILDSTGSLLHKPGGTAILEYKGTNISSAWPVESYTDAGWEIDTSFVYNGIVSYFAFTD